MRNLFANRFLHRAAHKALFAGLMLVCVLWSSVHAWVSAPAPVATRTHIGAEWPTQWDGAPLRPLALGDVEQRFARQFPGAMTRMTDGRRTMVMRRVDTPTRMLHPATDCYRALGFKVSDERLVQDAQDRRWRCFTAGKDGMPTLSVCERIEDAQGHAFTDTSAWYWSAVLGDSTGPWQAVTVAAPAT
ncbi:hypothetical protein QTH91_19835 [Variovorax dokdonensis]|uniref:Secreted protein n=1 Tax=Variovorax dokdonensis TaxID=344883 RepID=A0ABT7NFP6_9BURK|nr:hypothetical protein [Variovorax dokdonensis]MDM0046752.1 hypothetical protein [Variovorax dokdonensis]